MTDASSTVVWRQSTDAWGNVLSTTGSVSTNRGYGGTYGYERNGSGLLDVGVRAYDPALGRFLQQDEVEDAAGQPYAYCSNSPTNAVDPDGRLGVSSVSTPAGRQALLQQGMEMLCRDEELGGAKDAFNTLRGFFSRTIGDKLGSFMTLALWLGYGRGKGARGGEANPITAAGKVITVLGNHPRIKATGTRHAILNALFNTENLKLLCDGYLAAHPIDR